MFFLRQIDHGHSGGDHDGAGFAPIHASEASMSVDESVASSIFCLGGSIYICSCP